MIWPGIFDIFCISFLFEKLHLKFQAQMSNAKYLVTFFTEFENWFSHPTSMLQSIALKKKCFLLLEHLISLILNTVSP